MPGSCCTTGGALSGDLASAQGIGGQDDLEATADRLRATRAEVVTVTGDLLDEQAIAAVVATADRAFGRLDIPVNNAGIGYLFGPLTDMPAAHLDAVLGVNRRAPVLLTRDTARLMIRGAGGVAGSSTSPVRRENPVSPLPWPIARQNTG